MCTDCGCDMPKHGHTHGNEHSHDHHHHHHDEGGRSIRIEASLMDANERLAGENRKTFAERGVRVINVISSPGSGKTSLLAASIPLLSERAKVGVVVGDLETDIDARRLQDAGSAEAIQVTTGGTCHLDAGMVAAALERIPEDTSLLLVENVGNLVCPAAFDLGEDARVVLLSTTEGEDKPLKYPGIFAWADLVVITKIDLEPHLDFSMATARENIARVAPKAKIMEVSSRSGQGLSDWTDWLVNTPVVVDA